MQRAKASEAMDLDDVGIKTFEQEDARVLLTLFEERLQLLGKSDDHITINVNKNIPRVSISSDKGHSYAENKCKEITKWCSDLKDDLIKVDKSNLDEQKKVRDHLKSNKIYFTESHVSNACLFRLKTITQSVMDNCMIELHRLLGRSYQQLQKETEYRATVFEGNFVEKEKKGKSSLRQHKEITKWRSDLKEDVIKVDKSNLDEQKKVRDHLKSNEIYFTEYHFSNACLFRLKTITQSVMDNCMLELHRLLGRSYQQLKKETEYRATVFEGNFLEKEKKGKSSLRQHTSQNDQRDIDAKQKPESSKNQAGSLRTEKATHVHMKQSYVKGKLDVQLTNGLRFMVYVHDITTAPVEAIVNPANEDLANTGGCAYIISTAAGPKFESDCKEIIRKRRKIKVTENEISGPGKLPFMCIINAVGPQWASCDDNHKLSCLEDLYLTIRKVLDTSEKEKIKSVAIPPISSGIFGVPKELCAPMYVQAITDFDFMKKKYPQEVHIVDLSDEVLDLTCKAYQSFTEDPNNINPKAILKNYEIFTKEIITKQTISFDKYPEQNPCRLFKNDGEKAMFEMESGVKIFIYRDDLVMLRGIGNLVSAENSAFTGNGALAKSILQRAGPFYKKHHDQVQLDSRKKRVSKGSTIAMDAGKLDYRFVIHAVVSRFSEDADRKKDELVDLKITTLNVLRHADLLCTSEKKSKNLEKIAMPLLGAGDIRNPRILELLCSYVYQGIQEFFRYPSGLKEVHLVSFNEETRRAFMKVFLDVSANDVSASKNYPPLNFPSLRNTDNKSEVANSSSAIWKTKENVNWNDIHHKTKPTEESKCKCDYSDCDYLHCVEELEDKGITVSKTEKERTEKIMNTGML